MPARLTIPFVEIDIQLSARHSLVGHVALTMLGLGPAVHCVTRSTSRGLEGTVSAMLGRWPAIPTHLSTTWCPEDAGSGLS